MPEETAEVPRVTTRHPDEFTLLRLTAGDLDAAERSKAIGHVDACPACSARLAEIVELDSLLRDESRQTADDEAPSAALPVGDSFRVRPEPRPGRRTSARVDIRAAMDASSVGISRRREILEAAAEPRALADVLTDVDLALASERFAVLYALQEAGQRIAESPVRGLRLAEAVLERLRDDMTHATGDAEAGRVVPGSLLAGQAHALAGQACNWTSEFEKAEAHLRVAYRFFSLASDEPALATVELLESQRRTFVGRPEEALVLARRARSTFHDYGLEDMEARCGVAAANALSRLGMEERALELFRTAEAVFEEHSLWSNSINCLNNIGACLHRMGRLDEARREYARALQRFPRSEKRSRAFLRHGLAEVLFSAGRYREAALSLSRAARLYTELELPARALIASLHEIESWARSGDVARARRKLTAFLAEVERQDALDPSVSSEIARALSGEHADLERVAKLRQRAETDVQSRLGEASA